ncbi:MAG: carbohydrate kinase family protein [Sphaerochaetaceae bacterium]
MMQYECTFIGSVTKDILMRVATPPASDSRISADMFVTSIGGVSSIAGSAFQSLGGKGALISSIGDDDTGVFLKEDFKTLHFSYLDLHEIKGEKSSTSMIQIEHDGKRCLTCFGGCIDKLNFDMIDKSVLSRSRIVHLGVLNSDLMYQICAYCKQHTQALVSIDGGNLPQSLVEKLLPFIDIFVLDDKTVNRMLGLSPWEGCRYYLSKGVTYVCVTAGPDGSYLIIDGKECHIPTIEGVHVIDTTGAGDNFHGAMLWCMVRGWKFLEAVKFANIFASLTTEGIGGRMSAPSFDKVMRIYNSGRNKNE